MAESQEKSLGDQLAEDRTALAKDRTDMAKIRTFQAAERTYSAWVRTGFAIASAGLTVGRTLQNSENGWIALLIGGMLIAVGMLAFVYAWFGYKAAYNYLRETFPQNNNKTHPFKFNLATVTGLTVVLLIISVLGVLLMLF